MPDTLVCQWVGDRGLPSHIGNVGSNPGNGHATSHHATSCHRSTGLSTAPAYADLGDQLAKLLPDDGAADDRFGWSVAISGTTAIVGAYLDDDNGTDSGSAYLFDAAAAPGTCSWDLDDNSSVGVGDLLILLGAWGPNPGHPADFDCNDDVGVSDLLALLANWGPRP
ncbi:MAG: FG-GAP repeat protein [Phycisphaerales bacterium]